MPVYGKLLSGLPRCPFCGVANPVLGQVWLSDQPLKGELSEHFHRWGGYMCTTCGNVVTMRGAPDQNLDRGQVDAIFPDLPAVDISVPERARRYLQQAYESLHAPDAAAMTAGNAVDAMLKDKGYTQGSLYERIDKAVGDHLLTESMGAWAHEVRLGANRPRHADEDDPHVSHDDAKQSVAFVDALAQFLFVLPDRVQKGLEQAGVEQAGAAQVAEE